MKLLFVPGFLFAVIEYFALKSIPEYWCVKLIGIASGLILIPVTFYTYNGAIGKSPDFVNISIFFVAAGFMYWLENYLISRKKIKCGPSAIPFAALTVIFALFVIFTFRQPDLAIFREPF